MLQQDRPDDYVIATGESHSVRELVELAFAEAGLDWRKHVETDLRYLRPTEVDGARGRCVEGAPAARWRPRVGFPALVRMMVRHDVDLARRERTLKSAGYVEPTRGAAANGG